MAREPLYVCMTMDVERIGACSPTGGPPDWAFGARSVSGFCDVLEAFKLPATLFVVPDAAVEQGALLRKIAEETESELGLHLHPQCWKDHYLDVEVHDYLGGYTADEQHAMLAEVLDQVGDSLGDIPRAFRGGNFSANDDTFRVLCELGFTHGSVSQPGRSVTRFKACWKGAHLDVHFAHRAFRQVPGDLDFVEVPLTSDQSVGDHWTGVGDVRIESATAEEIAKATRQEVGRQVGDGKLIKHVCFLTHNMVNFWSDDTNTKGRKGVLTDALSLIEEIADDLGLEMKGATLQTVREAFIQKASDTGLQPSVSGTAG